MTDLEDTSFENMQTHRTGPTTPRLIHRALTPDDAPALFALNSHPDVMRYTGEPPMASVEEARDAIEQYPDFETVGYGRWGCVLKQTGQLIGFSGLKYLDEFGITGEVDVGFRFLPEYWGKGLATESALASLAYGFDRIGLEKIIALVLPENAASIRVLEKIGMSPDGSITYDGEYALRYAATRPA